MKKYDEKEWWKKLILSFHFCSHTYKFLHFLFVNFFFYAIVHPNNRHFHKGSLGDYWKLRDKEGFILNWGGVRYLFLISLFLSLLFNVLIWKWWETCVIFNLLFPSFFRSPVVHQWDRFRDLHSFVKAKVTCDTCGDMNWRRICSLSFILRELKIEKCKGMVKKIKKRKVFDIFLLILCETFLFWFKK